MKIVWKRIWLKFDREKRFLWTTRFIADWNEQGDRWLKEFGAKSNVKSFAKLWNHKAKKNNVIGQMNGLWQVKNPKKMVKFIWKSVDLMDYFETVLVWLNLLKECWFHGFVLKNSVGFGWVLFWNSTDLMDFDLVEMLRDDELIRCCFW